VTAAADPKPGIDWPVWALATAETLVWAGMFYLFPALLLQWETDLGWSKTDLTIAMTIAVATSAIGAPTAGRLIDQGYGGTVLMVSAGIGGILVGALSFVDDPWVFKSLWLGIGVCMAGCLYEPCFAFVTRTRGEGARKAITRITLVAGLAGTVSFPTANLIANAYGWRASTAVFCGLILFVAIPLFWYGTRPRHAVAETERVPVAGSRAAAMRRPVFWFLALSFASIALAHGMIITHLLPLLDERGVSAPLAVLTASLIGPMQVAGRLGMITIERRVSIEVICGLSFTFMIVAACILFVAGAVPMLLFVFVVVHGSGYGVTSITRPVVTANLLGREGFGAISGAMAVPFMAATALSPFLGSLIWSLGGYDVMIGAVLAIIGAGLLAFVLALRTAKATP